jgi:ubiquinone/menaquinone biosynthesis C-methylase UbiE
MNTDLKRYDLFGWDYEYINPLTEKEVAWYVKYAKETGGPVLEMACGSGRLLLLLAEAGFECDGIDICDEMLTIAHKRISAARPDVKFRIRLHKLDMTDFQLDRRYGLAIIADNSLRDLATIEKQFACISRAYDHLRPGGRLLVTLRCFDPAGLTNGRRETDWSKAIVHPETGEKFQRKVIMQLTYGGRQARGFILYKKLFSESNEGIIECPFEFPVMSSDDYAGLFSKAGFSTDVFIGYENREDDGKDVVFCFVCDKNE